MLSSVRDSIMRNPKLKQRLLDCVVHPIKARPRWWVRLFIPFYIKKGKGAHIYRSVRKDLLPNHVFEIGRNSIIEDYCALNNGVGDIIIGERARLGIGGTIIGPAVIGDFVVTGQNCLISGLVHNYEDPDVEIVNQGITARPAVVGKGTYLGSNCVVVAGATIGEHCVVGACSVVTRDIPPYTVCAGAPAKPIKRYDFEKKQWVRV